LIHINSHFKIIIYQFSEYSGSFGDKGLQGFYLSFVPTGTGVLRNVANQ